MFSVFMRRGQTGTLPADLKVDLRSSVLSLVNTNDTKLHTGVDKGGPGPPPNRWAKIFLVKIEGLSSLPPAKSGRACYDNPTGSISCPTCIGLLV